MRHSLAHRLRANLFSHAGSLILLLAMPIAALHAQQLLASAAGTAALPNAPSFLQTQAATGPATLNGMVTDLSGALVPQAIVKLEAVAPTLQPIRAAHSDAAGHFSLSGIAPGTYQVTVEAPGLNPATTAAFTLQAGERFELPTVTLAVATASASVTVGANSPEVAEAEINQQIEQRTLGIFPNFYTSYVWNAAPLTAKQKYKLTFHVLADPVSLIGFSIVAGIETSRDTFPQWGQDAPSYGKRFGAAFGDSLFSRGFDSAVFPALFHQDPRYFYMGPAQPVRKRLLHALSNGIICRGDNGHLQPNFSHIVGNASAGALSSVYHPASDSAGQLALDNSLLRLGFDALDATLREFVFSRITRHKPPYANGEPAGTPQP